MLGWLLLGALLGAAVITIYVSYVDENVVKRKMREKNIAKGTIKSIVESDGVTHINMDAIDNDGYKQEINFETEEYDTFEIRRGITIVA